MGNDTIGHVNSIGKVMIGQIDFIGNNIKG